jgi:hypothetical protein
LSDTNEFWSGAEAISAERRTDEIRLIERRRTDADRGAKKQLEKREMILP